MRVPRIHLPGEQAALVRAGLQGLQASRPGTYRSELGCLYGLPAQETQRVPSRMDELFWHLGLLPPRTGDRSVDSQAHPHVLLETVAQGAYQGEESAFSWNGKETGNLDGAQSQKLLAPVQDPGNTDRVD